jgi:hypothetical protein
MKRLSLLLLGLFPSYSSGAETLANMQSRFPVKMSGYVKSESYWDTRQVVGARDDQTLLYPEKIVLDSYCQDINAKGQYQMVALQSRFRFDITGPQIKNAKSSGVLEYDFFGKSDIVSKFEFTNIFRMRHAYLKLQWDTVSIIAGQFWHPFYTYDGKIYPRTVSFNTGIPIDTFSRNPQFRVTWSPSKAIDVIGCISSEVDFPSDGPIGSSTTYMRNAVIPMTDFQMAFHFNDHHLGFDVEYKRIVPRLVTDTGLKAHESLSSAGIIGYAALNWDSLSLWSKLIFLQNATDQNMIGGYGVHCLDVMNDRREYANLNTIAWWLDGDITRSESVIPGWFIGVAKNLGAFKTILPDVVDSEGVVTERRIYGTGPDIDTVFRFSPRIQWRIQNFNFCAEVEYTRAAYGTINDTGKVIDTDPVGVTRLLVALFYYF